jgi:hypothetical protein
MFPLVSRRESGIGLPILQREISFSRGMTNMELLFSIWPGGCLALQLAGLLVFGWIYGDYLWGVREPAS